MVEVNIQNKRILYISTIWFHYDKLVINKLIELGGIVDTFRIDIDSIYLDIYEKLRLSHAQDAFVKKYYDQILLKKDYDYVLVRYGFQLEAERIEKLRILNPKAKFINFHWDSIKPQYNYCPIIKYFDKVYSFDYRDCQNHEDIEYLPLFYMDEYATCENNEDNKKIDILFVGSWRNTERYNLINLTQKMCKENNLRFHYYLYSPLKTQIYFYKDHGLIQKEATSKILSHTEILKLFAISKTVIDFPSSFQTGLTMRCFETLAAGLKLITTNRSIIAEPFYNPEFINVIDTANFTLDIDFIKKTPTSSMIMPLKDYSLRNYINKLLQ